MNLDITPCMTDVLSNIGGRSVTPHDLQINGFVFKRLAEMGFLKIDIERDKQFPPYYSLTEKGEGAAAILTAPPKPVDYEGGIARIQRIVAKHFGISGLELTSARRGKDVILPRQIGMHLARRLTPKSLPEIGRRFGNRDHTTVIHAIKKIERLTAENDALAETVKSLAIQCGEVVNKRPIPSFCAASQGA